MKQRYLYTASSVKRIVILILIGLSITTLPFHVYYADIPSCAAAPLDGWTVELSIVETGGVGTIITLGGKLNASDNQDAYDLPSPPSPPQFPFLLAWFDTDFPEPFNRLLHEYKALSSDVVTWNFSVLWVAEPGNASRTTIEISWDPSQTSKSQYDSFRLYQDKSMLANMYTDDSVTVETNGSLHRFQIICQRESTHSNASSTDALLLPLFLGILLVVLLIIASIIWKKRK